MVIPQQLPVVMEHLPTFSLKPQRKQTSYSALPSGVVALEKRSHSLWCTFRSPVMTVPMPDSEWAAHSSVKDAIEAVSLYAGGRYHKQRVKGPWLVCRRNHHRSNSGEPAIFTMPLRRSERTKRAMPHKSYQRHPRSSGPQRPFLNVLRRLKHVRLTFESKLQIPAMTR